MSGRTRSGYVQDNRSGLRKGIGCSIRASEGIISVVTRSQTRHSCAHSVSEGTGLGAYSFGERGKAYGLRLILMIEDIIGREIEKLTNEHFGHKNARCVFVDVINGKSPWTSTCQAIVLSHV